MGVSAYAHERIETTYSERKGHDDSLHLANHPHDRNSSP